MGGDRQKSSLPLGNTRERKELVSGGSRGKTSTSCENVQQIQNVNALHNEDKKSCH